MQHIVYKNNIKQCNVNIDHVYHDLETKGYSLFNVGKINKDEFLEFCYNFGEVIPSGRQKPMIDDIFINDGTGTAKLPFHTDKSYWRLPPRYEILYVNDVYNMNYGEITVSSIVDAFNALTPNEQQELIQLSSAYKSPSNRDAGENPCANFVNFVDGKIEFFRYRLDIFNSNHPAIKKMADFIEDHHVKVKYSKADILILDNWKYAAGRNITEWGENGFRHLYRALLV